ncbi:MAG: methyltransferase domain-containing protein [Gammaproteobacteria bacterium]
MNEISEHYIIGGGAAGSERLRILADATWPASEVFLREAGLVAGARVLDAGCGNGAVTLRIAACAGATGRVTGLDRDAEMIRLACDEAKARSLAVEFRHGDIEHGAGIGEGYDLVYARLLLSHLGDPAAALARLAAALRPGGVLAVEDVDFQGHFCHPASPAFERYVAWYEAAAIMRGADPRIGRRLLDMLTGAGLRDVKLRVVLPTFHEGDGKRMALLTLSGIRDAVLGAGIVSAAEFDKTVSEIEAFTRAPHSIMSLPRFFQLRGVRA